MTDVVDKATRSRMMSGIRAKNTRPEMFIRKGLHRLGFRFRLHVKDLPGKPDIVLPKYRALIVVHGCFWHGHRCRYSKLPETNAEFWRAKISDNRQRDHLNTNRQLECGWRTLVIWECAIRAAAKKNASFDLLESASDWLVLEKPTACIDTTGLHFSP